jgi:hypothetical protein
VAELRQQWFNGLYPLLKSMGEAAEGPGTNLGRVTKALPGSQGLNVKSRLSQRQSRQQ